VGSTMVWPNWNLINVMDLNNQEIDKPRNIGAVMLITRRHGKPRDVNDKVNVGKMW
jgi:hypothetical protein